jgi:hypothetical protein
LRINKTFLRVIIDLDLIFIYLRSFLSANDLTKLEENKKSNEKR